MGSEAGTAGSPAVPTLRVGVLALQGSFREHIASLRRCAALPPFQGQYSIEAVAVRKLAELEGLQGLIIPGGESTTMAHIAERNGMIPALREFEASGKPIWGTCAGLIFLADRALGQKMGGQALLGGLDCTVHRNFFGSQINSFETYLPAPPLFSEVLPGSGGAAPEPFRAVFIRAPAIIETGAQVEVLSEYVVPKDDQGSTERYSASASAEERAQLQKLDRVAVAVKQGRLLATAFHPELTSDLRWHMVFLQMLIDFLRKEAPPLPPSSIAQSKPAAAPAADPGDLPVFGATGRLHIELKHT